MISTGLFQLFNGRCLDGCNDSGFGEVGALMGKTFHLQGNYCTQQISNEALFNPGSKYSKSKS